MGESSVRYLANLATLFKIEATYGVDAVPTGLANAIQFNDVTLVPMAGNRVSRALLKPYMGHQGVFLTGTHATLRGSVELAGAGEPGTIPAYGPLLRACGMHETVTEDEDVVYNPVSRSFEAGTLYYNLDGVLHVLLGTRGTFSIALSPAAIPLITFDFKGLKGTITDTALPAVMDYDGFIEPVPVDDVNTSMSLHGWDAIAESINIDLAATVEPRMLIGEKSVKITDRQATGVAVVQAASLATKDWFAIAAARAKGELAVQHGTVAGNIIEINAGAVQVGEPTQGSSQGIANYSLDLMLTPPAGNDEFTITVR